MTLDAQLAPPRPAPGFAPASLAVLDEPVRRYLSHALATGAPLGTGAHVTMAGRIKVPVWMPFVAEQDIAGDPGHAFEWRARAGWGPFKPLHVVDRYRDGTGSTDGRLLDRLSFMHSDDEDTVRASAGRAAVESILAPASLLPECGVTWRDAGDDSIVASFDVAPERVEMELRIGPDGGVRRVKIVRWGNVGRDDFGYIPFGAEVLEERRFGDVVLPSRITVGWWFDTPRYAPFFEATILSATPFAGRVGP